eukprot:TRINITY_DN74352_c0_g1_i1.p1 TRINITY_DN74352_c0_g1~~TRINITY_DN74352_c0_g1_i1.p1  ORF type:complete len:384 (-),score=51.98 TRINITY_DN74352_c0_g1_i1:90-1241(-)
MVVGFHAFAPLKSRRPRAFIVFMSAVAKTVFSTASNEGMGRTESNDTCLPVSAVMPVVEPSAEHVIAPELKARTRKVHRSKDGTTFIFDPETNSWRLDMQASVSSPSDGAPLSALPWNQFRAAFDGDFIIAGSPLLLAQEKTSRAQAEQRHGDTGRTIWDGAVALAKALERNPWLVEGQHVLELGAGRGLAGFSAVRLGARRTVVTDLPYCLEALREGAVLNGFRLSDVQTSDEVESSGASAVEVATLDWEKPGDFLNARPVGSFGVILAADVVWLLELVEPLVNALSAICENHREAQVLVVHQTRASNVEIAFLDAMRAASFELSWELRGADASQEHKNASIAVSGGVGSDRQQSVAWHPDYVPDLRIHLWCFRLRPRGDKD